MFDRRRRRKPIAVVGLLLIATAVGCGASSKAAQDSETIAVPMTWTFGDGTVVRLDGGKLTVLGDRAFAQLLQAKILLSRGKPVSVAPYPAAPEIFDSRNPRHVDVLVRAEASSVGCTVVSAPSL